MIRALIVDDEAPGRDHLRSRLENERDVEIVGDAADGAEAVGAIRQHLPDVVFLDIQMPGMNGFEVLSEIADFHLPVVIFVTAYDEYAINAFEANAVDYLLKPFTFDRFTRALGRAREQLELRDVRERHQQIVRLLEVAGDRPGGTPVAAPPTSTFLNRIPVREGESYFLLPVEELQWIEGARNYVLLHSDRGAHRVRSTLSSMEERLDPAKFARIHRSTVVNLDRIREIRTGWHGDFDVLLDSGKKVRMSRRYRDRVLKKDS